MQSGASLPSEASPDSFRDGATARSWAGPDAALLEALYRDEVLQARAMPPDEKLMAGERLFAWACAVTLAGIRDQFPQATEEECQGILSQRLALARKLQELP
jgi:hypothetical protein